MKLSRIDLILVFGAVAFLCGFGAAHFANQRRPTPAQVAVSEPLTVSEEPNPEGTSKENYRFENGVLKAVIVLRFDETHIVVNDYYQDFGARSVAPTIALKRQHGEFVPDLKAMRQPAPSLSDLCDMKEEFTKYGPFDGIYSAPPEVTDEVLQQLYNGQAKFARRYLNYCWPRHRPGKADYWRALMARVKESEYWPAVARLNRLPR